MMHRWRTLCVIGAVVVIGGSCVPDGGTNQLPVAHASATPDNGTAPLSVDFSSAGSADPDGTIAGYLWQFGDATPNSTDANPNHVYTAAGNYTATLTVTDNGGATGSTTVAVTVTGPGNTPPHAVANGVPTSGDFPLTVAFSSAGSGDAEGPIATYDWDFGDLSAHDATANPSHTYTAAGNYTATLTVTDGNGVTDSATVAISVSTPPPPNNPPTAVLGATPTSGLAPLTVDFNTTGSGDTDGTFTTSIDFGDGSPASTDPAPSHTYNTAGSYTATLTVTDDDNATDTDTITINAIGGVVTPTSGPAGTVISVTMPCAPLPGHPPVATAIVAFATTSNTVLATNSFDNSGTGQPNATVTVTVPPGTAAGAYKVLSSCDLYMTTTTYAATPFTVT